MTVLKNFLLVGLGGAAGSMLRYFIAIAWRGSSFLWATFAVNVAGSFLIGLLFAMSLRQEYDFSGRHLLLITGFCGGFTTFSAFSLENMQFLRAGQFTMAFLYIFLTIAVCIAATFAGFKLLNISGS